MKTKLHSVTRILAIFLIVSILAMPVISTISIKPVFAANVTLPFQDGFESGDFSKWSVLAGGSVTSGGAYDGTYKAVFSSGYIQAVFPAAVNKCYMRAYIQLNTIPTGANTSIFGLFTSGTYMAEAMVINVSGTLKWELRYFDSNGTALVSHAAVSEMHKPVLGKWYCVEVEGISNSATNAEARIYIDGYELTDVTKTGLNNTKQMSVGYLWISGSGTVWYDDVVIATSYIGPLTFLTINTVGSGSVSKSPDQTNYMYGTVVTLTATAAVGYAFTGWSGDVVSTTNPDTITMNGNKTVTATFNQITLKVDPATSNVTLGTSFNIDINVSDVVGLTAWQFSLYYPNNLLRCNNVTEGPFLKTGGGTFFNETITNNYDSTNGRLLAFCTLLGSTSASGSGVLATVSFTALADGDAILHLNETKLCDTALPPQPIDHVDIDGTVHVQSFTLAVTIEGSGTVNLNNTGPYYHNGEAVKLTAVPAIGWGFSHWSQDLTGSSNPTTLIITRDMSVTANFTESQYSLTINKVGSGSVGVNPLQATYTYGTQVTLSATADPGWTFAGWTGAPAGNPTTITITGDTTVTATFTKDQYTLTINSAHGSVSKSPDQATYTYGTHVTLTATSDAGWSFQYWSGASSDTTNTTTIIMTSSLTVTANYINKPTLQMSPTSKTCRVYHENFTVAISVSSDAYFKDFTLEIDYNTTLLDYVVGSVTWNLWGSGSASITVDEANGKITFSNSGTQVSGTQTLVTINFTVSMYHIFKYGAGWTNDLIDKIYFQSISISYQVGPDLHYQRGDSTQISVGPDFAYKFSPIQGDVDNSGIVDIFDIRTVAAYFDTNTPAYDLDMNGLITVADIQIVANNFNFSYVP